MNRFLSLILTVVFSLTFIFATANLDVIKSVSNNDLNQGDIITITFDLTAHNEIVERHNLDVMLTLDKSGSMAGQPLNDAKNAAIEFINQLDSTYDKVGLVGFSKNTFNKDAYKYSELTTDFDSVIAQINTLNANGGTNTGDGILKSNNELLKENFENVKVQILLSDGKPTYPYGDGDESDQEDYDYAFEQAQISADNNIIIYTISLGEDADQDFMLDIANLTNGKHYYAPNSNDLEEIFNEIKDEVYSLATSNIIIKDVLPEGVEINNLPENCSYNSENRTVTCEVNVLNNDESDSVSFDILVTNYNLNYVNEYTEINYSTDVEDYNIVFGQEQQPSVNVTNVAPDVNDVYVKMYSDIDIEIIIDALQSAFDYDDINIEEYSNVSNGILTNNDNLFTYTPNPDFVGDDNFEIIVSDGNLQTSAIVYITVNIKNHSPILNDITDISIIQNETIEFIISATDEDSNNLRFDLNNTYDWIELIDYNNTAAKVILKPTIETEDKNYNITFFVYDDYNKFDSKIINIKINPYLETINKAPILTAIANKTITEKNNLEFIIYATDEDSNNLRFYVQDLPDWATFLDLNNNSAKFSGIANIVNTYTVTFFVYDDKNLFDSKQMTIKVNAKSSGGGGGGSSNESDSESTITGECIPEVKYSEWSECVDGKQTRTFEIINSCENQNIDLLEKPCYVVEDQKQLIITDIIEDNNTDVNANQLTTPTGLFTLGNSLIPGIITMMLLLLGYAGYKIYNLKKKALL